MAVERIEEVYSVQYKGQTYLCVELLHVQRDRIPVWNLLKGKMGPKYHEYRVFDSTYPVRFYEPDFDRVKSELKDVPDHRTFQEKHPYAVPTFQVVNGVLTLVSYFI